MSPQCFESETSTDVPARLERLPWGSFHTLVVIALGVTWIIDGLEVTLAGALSGAFKQSPILRFTNTDVGFASSAYLAGAVLGALFFGWLTDRWGRKKLFFITLAVYVTATAATGRRSGARTRRLPTLRRKLHARERKPRPRQANAPGCEYQYKSACLFCRKFTRRLAVT